MIVFTFTIRDREEVPQPLTETDGQASSRSELRVWAADPAVMGRQGPSRRGPKEASPPEADDGAAWRCDALCRGLGTELFFPVGAVGPEAVEQAEGAKTVCRACPVREQCLEFSLATNQVFGVWGGLTEEERRPLRRTRRRTPA